MPTPRELIYVDMTSSIGFLVPKKRGTGYLRTPIYHMWSRLSEAMEAIPGVLDSCGLDGYVELSLAKNADREKIRQAVSKYFGMPMREDNKLFWSVLLPCKDK